MDIDGFYRALVNGLVAVSAIITVAVTQQPAHSKPIMPRGTLHLVVPPEFDHPHPNLIVFPLSAKEVHEACVRRVEPKVRRQLASMPGSRLAGCAQHGDGKSRCEMRYTRGSEASYRHERAHCNGWRHE
jgi:hypothetical protein